MHTQSGESLIEIILVLFLVSLAISGLMGTMLKAQQLSHGSIQQSSAAQVLSSFAHDPRSNRVDTRHHLNRYLVSLNAHSAVAVGCSTGSECSGAAWANQHIYMLHRRLVQTLPEFELIICRDITPFDGENLADPACDGLDFRTLTAKLWWSNRGVEQQLALQLGL
ncbi:MAG: type IV pilus modification PilV family protein [Pseudomonadales bacterium]